MINNSDNDIMARRKEFTNVRRSTWSAPDTRLIDG